MAKQSLGAFVPQDLANTAWAFATAGLADAVLFSAPTRGAKQRLGEFNLQDLANTACVFATASGQDALQDVLSKKKTCVHVAKIT